MHRAFFKTTLVHSCFSQELAEPQPKKCRCRKYVSKEQAQVLVNLGSADWLTDFSGDVPIPSWDVVLRGRQGKTPRTPTLERAHMERKLELEGEHGMRNPETIFEQTERFEQYHDIEIEERLQLFRGVGPELRELKNYSDTLKNLQGDGGRQVMEQIVYKADDLKARGFTPDPFPGRAILSLIGFDQRTQPSKNKRMS